MSEWDAYAGEWDDDPAAQAYAVAAFGSLQKTLNSHGLDLTKVRALDFGCGTGLLSEKLVAEGASVLGVDTSTAMLDVLSAKVAARDYVNVTVALELPVASDSFELIVCSSVCGFLDDYSGMVARLVRLLKPGGMFVQWDWERDDSDEDAHGLSRSEISDALRAAGLDQISVEIGFEAAFEDQIMRPLMGVGIQPAP